MIDRKDQAEQITSELLQSKAYEVGNNLKELGKVFPKTAGVLLLNTRIVPNQEFNDPDALTAKSMAMDYEYDCPENVEGLLKYLFDGRDKCIDLVRVNQGLDKLIKITSKRLPEDLLLQVKGQIIEDQLRISDDRTSLDEVRYLFDSKERLGEAVEELRASL